jgi:hypothetical protein
MGRWINEDPTDRLLWVNRRLPMLEAAAVLIVLFLITWLAVWLSRGAP